MTVILFSLFYALDRVDRIVVWPPFLTDLAHESTQLDAPCNGVSRRHLPFRQLEVISVVR